MRVLEWLKNNKLTALLILAVLFLLLKDRLIYPLSLSQSFRTSKMAYPETSKVSLDMEAAPAIYGSLNNAYSRTTPHPEVAERMVVEQSSLSLVVGDVRQKTDEILNEIEKRSGYMVSSSLNQPEEAPFATIVVRVPVKDLRSTLEYLRGLAIKVTSENLLGYDVTDQYVDLEARLNILYQTKTKFEDILNKASTVNEIMQVQQQIINLQSQIDSLKGQQQYLEKTAENAKLTIYLSTDEYSLPYAPETPSFRPKAIFKQAVRSLVTSLRGIATLAIWLGVFSVIWLPVVLLIKFLKRKKQ